MEPIKISQVLFLGEQDGASELGLKQGLSDCFCNVNAVLSAYLVRVSYKESPGIQIALCMNVEVSSRATVLPCVEVVFRKLFSITQHMDIFFLSDAQLAAINKVAKPFYTASTQ
jgi:hypothetical protein